MTSARQIANVRIPPHSYDAEVSVLGSVLIDKDARIEIADILRPEYFYDSNHEAVFAAMLELYEERVPIDLLTVSEKLKKTKKLKQVGGRAFLADLANSVPTASHVIHYAKIVRDCYTKRELISAAASINEVAFDEG